MSQDNNVQINEETVVEESTTATEKVPGSNPVVGSGEKSVVLEKQDIETNEKVNLIIIDPIYHVSVDHQYKICYC